MKRFALLALVVWFAACDSEVSEPPAGPAHLVITVSGVSGEAIGAALLSVEGTVDQVVVGPGWGLTASDDGRTLVAAVLTVPRTTFEIELEATAGATAAVELLQAADGRNAVYADPGRFTVEVAEAEDEL